MAARILVTGRRFVTAAHVRQLREVGFTVTRLDATPESEAVATALAGKQGYIWGGMEIVTRDVLAYADRLEAIAFPGAGYTEYIPAWRDATRRGIAIATAVGLNAQAVAEYAITLILAMVRGLPAITADPATPTAFPVHELGGLTLGVIGVGHTGRRTAALAERLGMRVLATGRREGTRLGAGIVTIALPRLLREADVVSLHVDKIHGRHVLKRADLRCMKRGAILVNVAFPDAVDGEALYEELRRGRLRAAFDAPPSLPFKGLPPDCFLASSRQAAFDTTESNGRVGDRVTQAMINMLTRGDDPGIANPDYRRHRPV